EVEERGTLLASGVIAGEAVAGIILAGLIVRDAQAGGNLTFLLAPVVLGILAALAAIVILGRTIQGNLTALALLLLGALGSFFLNGVDPASLDAGPLVGLAVLAYGSLVLGYLALRPYISSGEVTFTEIGDGPGE
ncbi:MAG: hypothetical protein R3185_02930, partial [Candidatus Thermoplasmatota archaeon]|nr:hypothetical protein [Candidatus Thermoplasmatota archaeon]